MASGTGTFAAPVDSLFLWTCTAGDRDPPEVRRQRETRAGAVAGAAEVRHARLLGLLSTRRKSNNAHLEQAGVPSSDEPTARQQPPR
jgi:hypothetical protein